MTFPDTGQEAVTDIIKSCFGRAEKEGRTEKRGGGRIAYHIFPDGVRILPEGRKESYLADYESLAEVAAAMIAAGEPEWDETSERRG